MGKNLILNKAFSALATVNEVKTAIAKVTDVKTISDLRKRVEAARKYDSQTSERRNYWGELAIWSERRIGELLIEAKSDGTIKQGRPELKGVTMTPLSLTELLGTETDVQARNISTRSQRLASHTQGDVEEAIEAIKADGEEVSKAAVNRKLVGAHVGHNSGENEWYTQPVYIEAARKVLGRIDLDPASSDIANKSVRAGKFYTAEQNGLNKKWKGNVWMNPPYSSDLIGLFCGKLVEHVADGSVTSAIVLVNNATDTQWFHTLSAEASAYCFPKGRVRFVDVDGSLGGTPLQGQCFLYFGSCVDRFADEFSTFGVVMSRVKDSDSIESFRRAENRIDTLKRIIAELQPFEAAIVRDMAIERLN